MTTGRPILFAVVSLCLHGLAALAFVLLPRAGALFATAETPPASVELVMEEHKGDLGPPAPPSLAEVPPVRAPEPPEAPRPPPPAPSKAPPPLEATALSQAAAPSEATAPSETPEPSPAPAPPPPPPEPPRAKTPADAPPEPARIETPPPPDTRKAGAAPERPAAPGKSVEKTRIEPPPTIVLRGTDSPSDAIAMGNNIVPAAPDAIFHNRPPVFPLEAARRGQGGAVVLTIHISPDGKAAGVDLKSGSGYLLLDNAAREAVLRWRFLPAVKDGQPVASDMTIQFFFDNH